MGLDRHNLEELALIYHAFNPDLVGALHQLASSIMNLNRELLALEHKVERAEQLAGRSHTE